MSFEVEQVFIEDSVNSSISAVNNYNLSSSSNEQGATGPAGLEGATGPAGLEGATGPAGSNVSTINFINFISSSSTETVDPNYNVTIINSSASLNSLVLNCPVGTTDGQTITISNNYTDSGTNSEVTLHLYESGGTYIEYIYSANLLNVYYGTFMWKSNFGKWYQIAGNATYS